MWFSVMIQLQRLCYFLVKTSINISNVILLLLCIIIIILFYFIYEIMHKVSLAGKKIFITSTFSHVTSYWQVWKMLVVGHICDSC